MGEFTTGQRPEDLAQQDKNNISDTEKSEEMKGYETDVPGVLADDEVSVGTDKFPVFDVSSSEFHQNMQYGRRRIRFKPDTPVQQYHRNTRYNRPFYIRYTDEKGKKYVRRVK